MADEDRVVVEETGENLYQQAIAVGSRHHLIADEPKKVGGGDTGPNPYDFLLAALGTCTSMTLRLYAERQDWLLEHVSVSLHHDRIHAKDCADCDAQHGMIDVIERVITLEGDLDAEQTARLLEIADKCPVHRTLMSDISIRTRLAGA